MTTNLKLVVTGDTAVGKTTMLWTYARNEFSVEYPSVFDHKRNKRNITVQGIPVCMDMWDTRGDPDEWRARAALCRNADVVVICYSIFSLASLEKIRHLWAEEARFLAREEKGWRVPIIIVGTKSDLRSNARALAGGELVPREVAQALGDEVGAEAVLECSARAQVGLREVFETATLAALQSCGYRRKSTEGKDKTCLHCKRPSKMTCECKRIAKQLRCAARAPVTVRQWCRIFSMAERCLARAPGPSKLLVDFFVGRPGLRRQVGGLIASYYNPCTAESLDTSSCIVM